MKKGDTFEAPEPTQSELSMRNILRAKKIPFKHGQVIWYTDYEKYTPDLVIGKKLVVEIDGKVHQAKYQKNKDRIRQRALENMGYTVFRVKNEEVQRTPDVIAEQIMGEYSELVATDIKKAVKITELKKPLNYESIPIEIDENLAFWADSFNKELDDEKWSIDYFTKTLSRFHPELVKNKSAMEKMILLLYGLNLRKMEDGNLDFEYSSNFLKKSISLLNDLFNEDNTINIHIKNMFNKSAPNFFKNLIFKGGPNLNPQLISIKDKNILNSHIYNFNKNLSKLGITVNRAEIIEECKATLQWFPQKDKMKYNWLIEWMNTD